MQSEHTYQIVGKTREVDFAALVDIVTCDIVVGEKIYAQSALKERQHTLVNLQV